MTDRPPQWTEENARNFQQQSVAEVYRHRMPYPPGVFERLIDLLPASGPRAVLDAGTGDGTIARALAHRVDHVDAVDFSPAMLAAARQAPNGGHPAIRWIEGKVEEVEPRPPYGLVVCGDSLHWMDWDVVLPRFAQILALGGKLAIVARWEDAPPWQSELQVLIERYSVYRDFRPADLVTLLRERRLFRPEGHVAHGPHAGRQSVDDYILSWHSRGGLARDLMPPAHIAAFGEGVRALVRPYASDGSLSLETTARITWGVPLAP